MMKTFFPGSWEKWPWVIKRAKMAFTAGPMNTLSRPSRCLDYGVHPSGKCNYKPPRL
jgi:hypothetical protein